MLSVILQSTPRNDTCALCTSRYVANGDPSPHSSETSHRFFLLQVHSEDPKKGAWTKMEQAAAVGCWGQCRVWRHFCLSWLVGGRDACNWHWVGQGQGCCSSTYSTQDRGLAGPQCQERWEWETGLEENPLGEAHAEHMVSGFSIKTDSMMDRIISCFYHWDWPLLPKQNKDIRQTNFLEPRQKPWLLSVWMTTLNKLWKTGW